MSGRNRHPRRSANAIAAAKPGTKEYTLWDGTPANFGARVHRSGVRSFIVQTRVNGRMRKFILGRFPEMGVGRARREATAILARLWAAEAVAPPRKTKAPLFRDFAARYRERRRRCWKPSSLGAARDWGERGAHVPDACAIIARKPGRPVARFLRRDELMRLGVALDRYRARQPSPVAAIRLLPLTGARLSEALNLRWVDAGASSEGGASARIADSKIGPRTVAGHALLIADEVARREHKKFNLRIRRAGFRSSKTLEQFDFDFNPAIDQGLITELATCRFVAEKVAVLIAGPCGTGKSHIAQALGHAAVRADHDVLFTTQSQLLASLNAARAINAYERRFQTFTFTRVPLLVIDDFGLKPL